MKHLLVFAKAPKPGEVKTRLQLPADAAAQLHAAFVKDVLARHGHLDCQLSLWRGSDPNDPFWTAFDVPQYEQRGRCLGERMASASETMLASPADSVVIIGTDSPSLPPRLIEEAFVALSDCDVVLGPACDGGYYLVGLRRTIPALFPKTMPWGTNTVLQETIEILARGGYSYRLLEFWYDVDRPDDLKLLGTHVRYLEDLGVPAPKHTIRCLSELGLSND